MIDYSLWHHLPTVWPRFQMLGSGLAAASAKRIRFVAGGVPKGGFDGVAGCFRPPVNAAVQEVF